MKHLPDPDRTVFDHETPLTEFESKSIVSLDAIQLRETIEARFIERRAFCGADLKVSGVEYILASHAGREVPFTAVCGDCLGQLDERRRLEGLPPLHEVVE